MTVMKPVPMVTRAAALVLATIGANSFASPHVAPGMERGPDPLPLHVHELLFGAPLKSGVLPGMNTPVSLQPERPNFSIIGVVPTQVSFSPYACSPSGYHRPGTAGGKTG